MQGAPALVIEIASTGTRRRDEGSKLRLFEREGVREYWLVDHDRDRINVWRRRPDGSFPRVAELWRERGDMLTTPLLPELKIPLVQLFSGA